MDTCWFCERNPALANTAFTATVYGNPNAPPPSNGRRVTSDGDVARVAIVIPRCATCARQQRRQTALALGGLVLGVVILAGAYVLITVVQHRAPFEILGSAVATAVCLGIAGFLGGLLGGVLVSARVNRGMARRDARVNPEVVALTSAGWYYDPPGGD